MKPTPTCTNCGSALHSAAFACFACGLLQGGAWLECENHPEERASHLCVVCGKPVCDDCSVSAGGRTLCDNAEHQRLLLTWVVVFETTFEFEADQVERNLQQAGINCVVMCLNDHVATFGIEEVRRIRVLVPGERAERARTILKELHLATDSDMSFPL